MTRTRRLLGTALGIAGAATLAAIVLIKPPTSRNPPEDDDLRTEVVTFSAALDEDAPYRPPTDAERSAFLTALRTPEESSPAFARLGMTTHVADDHRTGRRYAVIASEPNDERGWGMYVIDLTVDTRVAVQVPHPTTDLLTEEIGVALFRQLPGAVLSVAGTHRRATNGAGDVAHETTSMFHAVAEDHARRGLPQLQLHGYDDTSLRDADIVLSPGASDHTDALANLADRLDHDFRVCAAWQQSCGNLEGRRNRQGITAARHDSPFVHIELNRTVREDEEARETIVSAIAATDFSSE